MTVDLEVYIAIGHSLPVLPPLSLSHTFLSNSHFICHE